MSSLKRIAIIIAVLAGAHIIVLLIRRFSDKVLTSSLSSSFSKVKSIVSLISSILVFVFYFTALGLVMNVFGLSLTAYFASATIVGLAVGFGSQGLVLTRPSIEDRRKTSSNKEFIRIKFRLWPGRTGLIETTFKQEVLQVLKEIDSSYADWMVAVNYEVEEKMVSLPMRSKKKAR